MNHAFWSALASWTFAALLLVGCDAASTSTTTDANNNSDQASGNDESNSNTGVTFSAFVGLGPLAPGSTVEFFELDPMTAQRTTSEAAATVVVEDRGAMTLPSMSA